MPKVALALYCWILTTAGCGGGAGSIEKIVAGLSLVCVSSRPDCGDCARGKVPATAVIEAHRFYVYDVPNSKSFERSWEFFEKRIRAEGFRVLERPGPGPRGLHSIYVGGPLYVLKFSDGRGVYTLSTTIVESVRRPVSDLADWRPESVVLATP